MVMLKYGHPIPLNCPKDKARSIFSTFYYSNKNEIENEEIHFTKYVNKSNKCEGRIKIVHIVII